MEAFNTTQFISVTRLVNFLVAVAVSLFAAASSPNLSHATDDLDIPNLEGEIFGNVVRPKVADQPEKTSCATNESAQDLSHDEVKSTESKNE